MPTYLWWSSSNSGRSFRTRISSGSVSSPAAGALATAGGEFKSGIATNNPIAIAAEAAIKTYLFFIANLHLVDRGSIGKLRIAISLAGVD